MNIYTVKYTLVLKIILLSCVLDAQQNLTMYNLYNVPESGLLNPAIPIPCKWYIGLPLISSNHVNLASNNIKFQPYSKQIQFNTGTRSIFSIPIYTKSYLMHEAYFQIFALGYREKSVSYTFSVTEKNNSMIALPRKSLPYILEGNNKFLGEELKLNGLDVSFNHYREYAFTIAKNYSDLDFWGIRAKLLFGKLNLATKIKNISAKTDETSFNLFFQGEGSINTSLPIIVNDPTDIYRNIDFDDNISPFDLLLNRKNPGIALDLGITKEINRSTIFAASIVDLGFISWNSNKNNFMGEGEYSYKGPLGDTIDSENYLDELLSGLIDSLNLEINSKSHLTILSPRITTAVSKTLTPNVKVSIQTSIFIKKTTFVPSLTFSGEYTILKNINTVASYSLQHNSYNNIGVGIIVGKSPFQFYAITDNVFSYIPHFYTRNINIRFGLNINLNCKAIAEELKRKKGLNGKCNWVKNNLTPGDKYYRIEKLSNKITGFLK